MQAATRQNEAKAALSDDMLARFSKRAPQYDRDNVFFSDDFDELPQAGYLRLAVPTELGGGGLSLAGVARAAAASGLPRRADRAGDQHAPLLDRHRRRSLARRRQSQRWLLEAAARGRGVRRGPCRERQRHPGAALDHEGRSASTAATASPAASRSAACRPSGPTWAFTGWTRADPSSPKIVHAFMPRDTEGYRIEETWDVLGMRATSQRRHDPRRRLRARSLRRQGRARRRRRHRRLRARALRLGAARLRQHLLRAGPPGARSDHRGGEDRSARSASSRSMAYHAELQHRIARDGAGLRVDRAASRSRRRRLVHRRRITAPRGRPRSSRRSITPSKASWRIVDLALEVAGGFGIFRRSGLEQLFRDARLGRIHPANSMLTHEIVAKTLLGISPDETPRWG